MENNFIEFDSLNPQAFENHQTPKQKTISWVFIGGIFVGIVILSVVIIKLEKKVIKLSNSREKEENQDQLNNAKK